MSSSSRCRPPATGTDPGPKTARTITTLPGDALRFLRRLLRWRLGWRGYLLPLVQARMGSLAAGVGILLLRALWHVALFLLGSLSQAWFPPGWYLQAGACPSTCP